MVWVLLGAVARDHPGGCGAVHERHRVDRRGIRSVRGSGRIGARRRGDGPPRNAPSAGGDPFRTRHGRRDRDRGHPRRAVHADDPRHGRHRGDRSDRLSRRAAKQRPGLRRAGDPAGPGLLPDHVRARDDRRPAQLEAVRLRARDRAVGRVRRTTSAGTSKPPARPSWRRRPRPRSSRSTSGSCSDGSSDRWRSGRRTRRPARRSSRSGSRSC